MSFMNTQLCPLCGRPNRCAMEVEKETGVTQPPCWCTQRDFSAELLARVPTAAQGTACVCAACQAEASSLALTKPAVP
jgi:hypothetical protein